MAEGFAVVVVLAVLGFIVYRVRKSNEKPKGGNPPPKDGGSQLPR